MTTLRLGDTAPDFTAETTEGTINFHEWLGDGWGILFSRTPPITHPSAQRNSARSRRSRASSTNATPSALPVSVDPLDSHKGWISDINETQNTTGQLSRSSPTRTARWLICTT